MGRIFLSYSSQDRPSAARLAQLLEGHGHSVWWDRHIDSGADFTAEIETQLHNADVVLVAWSKTAVHSRWVRDEASVGGDSGRLVPVSLDSVRPPMGFRQFHTLDLSGWKASRHDPRTRELLHSIESRLNGNSKASERQRTAPGSRAAFAGARPRWLISVPLVAAAAASAYLWFGREHSVPEGVRPTIAIAPFTSVSPDPALQSLANQTRDATAHSLTDSGMQVRVDDDKEQDNNRDAVYSIAGEISGGEKIVATIRLDDARHGTTVWSRRFEVDRKDAPILAERVGAQVAGTLSWAAVLRTLDQGQTADPGLTADLLRQLDLNSEGLQKYQIAQRLAPKWPESGMAQLGLAFYTGFLLSQLPREERADAVAAARRAAQRAQQLMPTFGDTYIPACLLQPPTHLAQCEDRYRAALRTDPDAPFANAFLAGLLNDVGRTNDAVAMLRLSYAHDPYVPLKIAFMIQMLTVTGDDAAAEKLYRRAIVWWPESGLQQALLWGLIERGDFAAMVRHTALFGPAQLDPGYKNLIAIAEAVNARSLASLRTACDQKPLHWLEPPECMLALARLGDLDSAYALAERLYPARVAATPHREESLWLESPDSTPLEFLTSRAATSLRRDPRYLAVAQRTGLTAYWRRGRLPDFCQRPPEVVCKLLQ